MNKILSILLLCTTAIFAQAQSAAKLATKQYSLAEENYRLWHMDEAIEQYQQSMVKSSNPQRDSVASVKIQHAQIIQKYLKRVEDIEVISKKQVTKQGFLASYPIPKEMGSLSADSANRICYRNERNDRLIQALPKNDSLLLISRIRLLNRWEEADTLPENINFTTSQNYPYILSDGATLFFSAQDPNGLGGWDIYVSKYNSETDTYTNPENLGFPFNSEKNDYMFVLDEQHNRAYFATDRFSPDDSVDIFTIKWNEEKKYIKLVSQDSLIAFAKLQLFTQSEDTLLPSVPTPKIETKTKSPDCLHLIINDHTIYTSYTDFRNTDARLQYNDYLTLSAQLTTINWQLLSLRKKYTQAPPEQQVQMTSQILRLEQKQALLQQQLNDKLNLIRLLETSSLSK